MGKSGVLGGSPLRAARRPGSVVAALRAVRAIVAPTKAVLRVTLPELRPHPNLSFIRRRMMEVATLVLGEGQPLLKIFENEKIIEDAQSLRRFKHCARRMFDSQRQNNEERPRNRSGIWVGREATPSPEGRPEPAHGCANPPTAGGFEHGRVPTAAVRV